MSAFAAEWASPTNDPLRAMEHIAFTLPYNMSEQPAISVPCGHTAGGLPIGLQIIGRRHDDLGVLRLARAWEAAAAAAAALAVAALSPGRRGPGRRARYIPLHVSRRPPRQPHRQRQRGGARGGRAGAVADDVVLRHAAGRPGRGDGRRPRLGDAARHEGRLSAQPDRADPAARGRRPPVARTRPGQGRARRASAPTSTPCNWCWRVAGTPPAGAWDALLLQHPRDALALQWAQLWDFYRGDAAGLRLRPARALPEWDEADPLFGYVLALHAFGLEESNLYPQAEDAGRRALAVNPRVPWAVHAVAHVMEMQGRFEEGSAWLRQHQPAWAEGNGFACHLWWHKALFRLEALDAAGVLRLVDAHLSGGALQITLQRVDAAAMLWRLHLLGEDVSARCAEVLSGWDLADGTRRPLRLQRRARGARDARRRRRGARRILAGALRRACAASPPTPAAATTRWRARSACR